MKKSSPKHAKRILNCVPSKGVEKDWGFAAAVTAKVTALKKTIPVQVDLREKWWHINDQYNTGSCVGWATADGLLRWHYVKNQLIRPNELLSVRFIWMAAKETDEFTDAPSTFIDSAGTSLKASLDIARKYGCVTDKILPFGSAELSELDENEFFAIASTLKIANYFNLRKNTDPILAWKRWIADGNGPILVRLDVDDTWMNALKTKGKLDVYDTASADGGHAVCIVGYTPDRIIIRNSWGETQWGDKGFGYASYDYARAAFTEAYGISLVSSAGMKDKKNLTPAKKGTKMETVS
jgi:hypothetical protein